MTTVTFYTEGSRIIGFDASGHSGYAEEGGDIVCAAAPIPAGDAGGGHVVLDRSAGEGSAPAPGQQQDCGQTDREKFSFHHDPPFLFVLLLI